MPQDGKLENLWADPLVVIFKSLSPKYETSTKTVASRFWTWFSIKRGIQTLSTGLQRINSIRRSIRHINATMDWVFEHWKWKFKFKVRTNVRFQWQTQTAMQKIFCEQWKWYLPRGIPHYFRYSHFVDLSATSIINAVPGNETNHRLSMFLYNFISDGRSNFPPEKVENRLKCHLPCYRLRHSNEFPECTNWPHDVLFSI